MDALRLVRVFIGGYFILVTAFLLASILDFAYNRAAPRDYYAISFDVLGGVAIVALTGVLVKLEQDRDTRERPDLRVISVRGWSNLENLYLTVVVVNRGGRDVAVEEFLIEARGWKRLLSPARVGSERTDYTVASGDRAEFTLLVPHDTEVGPGRLVRAVPVIGTPTDLPCKDFLRDEKKIPLEWIASRLVTDLLRERDA